ncbi:hypothetical protein D3C85_1121840 [compost metagenome]
MGLQFARLQCQLAYLKKPGSLLPGIYARIKQRTGKDQKEVPENTHDALCRRWIAGRLCRPEVLYRILAQR